MNGRINVLNQFEIRLVSRQGSRHSEIQCSSVQILISEGYPQYSSNEEELFIDSFAGPSSHKLSSQSSLIVSFFLIILNLESRHFELVKSNVERTLSRYVQCLTAIALVLNIHQPKW